MSTSNRGRTVLFENLNGLGGPLNQLFMKNPFAQPIFRPKDNPFSPREVSNKKVQILGHPNPGILVPVQVEVLCALLNIFSYLDHPHDE